jgi:hypothetical protein
VLALATVLLPHAETRPDTFRVERSIRIQVPAEKIFPLIDGFHRWERRAAWEKIDPSIRPTCSRAARGKGGSLRMERRQ